GEHPGADDEQDRVQRDAGPPELPPALVEAALAVVAHEPARPADAVHHLVARVDAIRAADALELRAVADVDADRAHRDAAPAVDAIARPGGAERAARLAARPVVADVDRVAVVQHALQAA